MTKAKRITAEQIAAKNESIKRQQKQLRERKMRKRLQDLEDLAAAVLKRYEAETGNTATIEELTAYYLDGLKKEQ